MAAQPKNKITRVEQGKRRHGNTPKLKKDVKMSRVPLYKRAFFDKIMQLIGGETASTAAKSSKVTPPTASGYSTSRSMNPIRGNGPKTSAPVKKIARTQHKGS
jgi:hypothetical protein